MAESGWLAYARRQAVLKGLLGGHRPWLYAGGVAWALRVIQRVATKEEHVVYQEELAPGETVVIRHESEPSPRRRRRRA